MSTNISKTVHTVLTSEEVLTNNDIAALKAFLEGVDAAGDNYAIPYEHGTLEFVAFQLGASAGDRKIYNGIKLT